MAKCLDKTTLFTLSHSTKLALINERFVTRGFKLVFPPFQIKFYDLVLKAIDDDFLQHEQRKSSIHNECSQSMVPIAALFY